MLAADWDTHLRSSIGYGAAFVNPAKLPPPQQTAKMPGYSGFVSGGQTVGRSLYGGAPPAMGGETERPPSKRVDVCGAISQTDRSTGLMPGCTVFKSLQGQPVGGTAYASVRAPAAPVEKAYSIETPGRTPPQGAISYRRAVNGVLPGYTGHMPKARQKVAETVFGGYNAQRPPSGEQGRRPAPSGSAGPSGDGVIIAGSGVPEKRFPGYMRPVAGYKGFRPRASQVVGSSSFTSAQFSRAARKGQVPVRV